MRMVSVSCSDLRQKTQCGTHTPFAHAACPEDSADQASSPALSQQIQADQAGSPRVFIAPSAAGRSKFVLHQGSVPTALPICTVLGKLLACGMVSKHGTCASSSLVSLQNHLHGFPGKHLPA